MSEELLLAVQERIMELGYVPSVRDITKHLESIGLYRGSTTVHHALTELEQEGIIMGTISGSPRWVLHICPHCKYEIARG